MGNRRGFCVFPMYLNLWSLNFDGDDSIAHWKCHARKGWPQSWPDFDNCKINSTRKPFKNNLLLLMLFDLRWTKMYVSQVLYTVASTAKYPDTIPVPQWNCNLILKFCSVMHLLYCLSFLSWIKLSKCFSFSCFRRIFQHIQIKISSLADCYYTWTLYVLQMQKVQQCNYVHSDT